MKLFSFSAALLMAGAAAVPLMTKLAQQDSTPITAQDLGLGDLDITDQELNDLYNQFMTENQPLPDAAPQDDWLILTTDPGTEATYTDTTPTDNTVDIVLPPLITDYEFQAQPDLEDDLWLDLEVYPTETTTTATTTQVVEPPTGTYTDVPEVEDEVPEVEDDVPEVEDELPEVEDDVPEVEDELPEVEDDVPEVEDEEEEVEDEQEVDNLPDVAEDYFTGHLTILPTGQYDYQTQDDEECEDDDSCRSKSSKKSKKSKKGKKAKKSKKSKRSDSSSSSD